MQRRGLDHKNMAARGHLRAERELWMAGHPRPTVTLAEVAEHVEHVRDMAGIDHVGIGSDYDGVDWLPEGLQDVSGYPALIAELTGCGWSEEDCGKLARGNILRVMREAEAASQAISARRGPSRARLEDLDQQCLP
jgi:membrane dipeptidase